MSAGEIIRSDTYDQLMASSQEFQDLVNAHKNTAGPDIQVEYAASKRATTSQGEEIQKVHVTDKLRASWRDQLIRQEERETGDVHRFQALQTALESEKGHPLFLLVNYSPHHIHTWANYTNLLVGCQHSEFSCKQSRLVPRLLNDRL
jgi:hypothetical protein